MIWYKDKKMWHPSEGISRYRLYLQRMIRLRSSEWMLTWLVMFTLCTYIILLFDSRNQNPQTSQVSNSIEKGLQNLTNTKQFRKTSAEVKGDLDDLPEKDTRLKTNRVYERGRSGSKKSNGCNIFPLATRNNVVFKEALARVANKDNIIILSYVDMGFLDMAYNFIETSVYKHNLTNVLFFSSSKKACESIESKHCVPCYVSSKNDASEKESPFGSLDFISKMNIRSQMIRDALYEGYNVLHTDSDVVFLRNPLVDIEDQCNQECDIATMWDSRSHNAGFLYIRPTKKAMHLYNAMIAVAKKHPDVDDQRILNSLIEQFQEKAAKDVDEAFQIRSLPSFLYLNGQEYFTMGQRHFSGDNPCSDCIVVHNNFLVDKFSKIWRFKEMHLWMVDEKGYYSDPHAKYITYNNPFEAGDTEKEVQFNEDQYQMENTVADEEKHAIHNAFKLAYILNRTLILPKFHASQYSPPEPMWYVHGKLLQALLKVYPIQVRESTFLTHPKVPNNIKNSVSKRLIIPLEGQMDDTLNRQVKLGQTKKFLPRNRVLGPTEWEIKQWFRSGNLGTISVLKFHSLKGDFTLLKKQVKGESKEEHMESRMEPRMPVDF